MQRFFFPATILLAALLIYSCGSDTKPATDKAAADSSLASSGAKTATAATDEAKGHGKFTQVTLTDPPDQAMAGKGKSTYDVKCGACHKLTNEKLVGPGWKGVTERRKPEWIMNFITNTDEMIDKDPAAQAMLEECMVRMPNQHLSDDDARNVLEFMRSNDVKK
ncbi:cytochrome c [Chitinophaga sp. 212800010-3]|uniref:c-type cytochrome n=1 Tax=unclassified Chitinophaga TaxID=2619133 RepID=UPI002DEFB986|nr:Cytochrome C [Chitinophaga sp. 212800010-3]